MDAVEKAIRSALEKGDADERGFREGVYRKAFAALERAIESNPAITPDVAERRRASVKSKIAEIESEFIPAIPPVAAPIAPPVERRPEPLAPRVPPAAPRMEPAPAPAAPRAEPPVHRPQPAAPRVEPSVPPRPVAPAIDLGTQAAAPSDRWREEPTLDAPTVASAAAPRVAVPEVSIAPQTVSAAPPSVEIEADGLVPKAYFPNLDDFDGPVPEADDLADAPLAAEVSTGGGPNVSSERRRPFAALFIGTTILAAVGIGIWWGVSTGLFKTPAEIDSAVPNPPATVEEEDFIPEEENNAPQLPGEADAERKWIIAFSPDDSTTVNAPGGTSAEVQEDDTGTFMRIRSSTAGSAVIFDIGQGILEQIAGQKAVFDVTARSEEGKDTQFAVECNFGELGDCGRKRYAAGYSKGEFLFEIEMPAKQPGAAGTIAINPDITNGGKALDIYEIRVSTE